MCVQRACREPLTVCVCGRGLPKVKKEEKVEGEKELRHSEHRVSSRPDDDADTNNY
jgi:hypothetical protein